MDAFRVFSDNPENGLISSTQIRNIMHNVLNEDQIDDFIEQGSPDELGNINFEEFVKRTML